LLMYSVEKTKRRSPPSLHPSTTPPSQYSWIGGSSSIQRSQRPQGIARRPESDARRQVMPMRPVLNGFEPDARQHKGRKLRVPGVEPETACKCNVSQERTCVDVVKCIVPCSNLPGP
jgi:hypothetical protein